MAQLMDLLESYHGTKQTFCFGIVSEDPNLDDLEVWFLDLLAGSSSVSSVKKRPASIRQHQDPQNDGEVDVGAELRRLLCDEVTAAIRAIQTQAGNLFPVRVALGDSASGVDAWWNICKTNIRKRSASVRLGPSSCGSWRRGMIMTAFMIGRRNRPFWLGPASFCGRPSSATCRVIAALSISPFAVSFTQTGLSLSIFDL